MDELTVLTFVGIILTAVGLVIAFWAVKRWKPKLSVEVIDCKHGIKRDENAFLLRVDYRVHNIGDNNTTITGLEVSIVDAQGNLQNQTLTLKQDVGAGESTEQSEALFSFTPPFPYDPIIECHFVLYHTFGEKVFAAISAQSDLTNIGKLGFSI
jgi:hypothetical protein